MTERSGLIHPLTPADYEKFAASVKGHSNTIAIAKLPPNLSPDYRLGYNLVYGHANHGWVPRPRFQWLQTLPGPQGGWRLERGRTAPLPWRGRR